MNAGEFLARKTQSPKPPPGKKKGDWKPKDDPKTPQDAR
jgi:hypothetical protein